MRDVFDERNDSIDATVDAVRVFMQDDFKRRVLRDLPTDPVAYEDVMLIFAALMNAGAQEAINAMPYREGVDFMVEASGRKAPDDRTIQRIEAANRKYLSSEIMALATDIQKKAREGFLLGSGRSSIEGIGKIIDAAASRFANAVDTGLNAFDRAILEAVSDDSDLWIYVGPRDNKNRPFCAAILSDARAYTDAGITQLNSHPLLHSYVPPNVKTLAGGINCRHVFLPMKRKEAIDRGFKV